MRYVSTRGHAEPQLFDGVLLSGPASDGGLFVPETWPRIAKSEIAAFASSSYADAAFAVLSSFVDGVFPSADLRADIESACAAFDGADVAPLTQLRDGLHLLELFHGPTLAFKDVAMQLLGRLLSRLLSRHGTIHHRRCRDVRRHGLGRHSCAGWIVRLNLFVLHPKGA
jgi:threonine synthase